MIFVTIGTCEPFDRLLASLDGLDLDEEIVAQTGLSATNRAGFVASTSSRTTTSSNSCATLASSSPTRA